ncbi:MAG: hypothetical protein KBC41_02450 [Candidatus Pacebacteria bacterium]|nr:hypothetical protein [Candidatus Paceibacterota bacterium]
MIKIPNPVRYNMAPLQKVAGVISRSKILKRDPTRSRKHIMKPEKRAERKQ